MEQRLHSELPHATGCHPSTGFHLFPSLVSILVSRNALRSAVADSHDDRIEEGLATNCCGSGTTFLSVKELWNSAARYYSGSPTLRQSVGLRS
jgi:hypothetical protein